MTYLLDLLNEVAEFLEGQMDADGTQDGYKPNRAMQLHQQVEAEIQRMKVYGGPKSELTLCPGCGYMRSTATGDQ